MEPRQIDAALARAFGHQEVRELDFTPNLRSLVMADPLGIRIRVGPDHLPAAVVAVPAYSTTWEGMGQVVEAMRERDFMLVLRVPSSTMPGPTSAAFFDRTGRGQADHEDTRTAVALAALAALKAEVPA